LAKALSYSPFLKLKVNEIAALVALSVEVLEKITPFFDLPRKSDQMSEAVLRQMVTKAARKVEKNLGKEYSFYLDNFDLSDDWTIDGEVSYSFVIDAFRETMFIPVLGVDRHTDHAGSIWKAKSDGLIKSSTLAIRLLEEDFLSFALVQAELADLSFAAGEAGFSDLDLILDCRLCRNHNSAELSKLVGEFIQEARGHHDFRRVVVTGSSIPASIADVIKVLQQSEISRVELQVVSRLLAAGVEDIVLGDYTIVSPLYSEVSMPPEMLLNITAPKVMYSYVGVHYIQRGGALRTHARGNFQYNDIASALVGLPFFRGRAYSYGDEFIDDRAKGVAGKMVTPGSILKPTINAHITYMASDHPLVQ
jgi:hypothetical protein